MFLSDQGSVKMHTGSRILVFTQCNLFDFYSQMWVISEVKKGTLKRGCVESAAQDDLCSVNVMSHLQRALQII